jgi:hypothetical protein
MRGAPHNGLAAAISRTSARVFASIVGGRPTRGWRDRRVQRRRNQSPCHRTTVSGWTNIRADRHRIHMAARAIQNSRSRWRSRGRVPERLSALSCCLSAIFSRTSSRCPRQARASARASDRIISSTRSILSCRAALNQRSRAAMDCGEGHVVGILARSLALLSDAAHMLTDAARSHCHSWSSVTCSAPAAKLCMANSKMLRTLAIHAEASTFATCALSSRRSRYASLRPRGSEERESRPHGQTPVIAR